MDSQTSQPQHQGQERPDQHLSRADVRHLIYYVVYRRLLEVLPRRREDDAPNTPNRRRLNKGERCIARRQARMLENMLYKRASCLEDYRDLSTLVDRVMKARQTVRAQLLRTIGT